MPNKRKINNILKYIKEHPDEWNQTDWYTETPCGTRFCFAGFAAVRSKDFRLLYYKDAGGRTHLTGDVVEVSSGDVMSIQTAAGEILDLNNREAGALFYGHNGIPDLERVIKGIYAGSYPA